MLPRLELMPTGNVKRSVPMMAVSRVEVSYTVQSYS